MNKGLYCVEIERKTFEVCEVWVYAASQAEACEAAKARDTGAPDDRVLDDSGWVPVEEHEHYEATPVTRPWEKEFGPVVADHIRCLVAERFGGREPEQHSPMGGNGEKGLSDVMDRASILSPGQIGVRQHDRTVPVPAGTSDDLDARLAV